MSVYEYSGHGVAREERREGGNGTGRGPTYHDLALHVAANTAPLGMGLAHDAVHRRRASANCSALMAGAIGLGA